MIVLLEPRHEMNTWQLLQAMLTRAWLKLSNSPPELAETLMALHAFWWGFGLTLEGYAINPERPSLLNGMTEHWFGGAFMTIAILKFAALVLDLYHDSMGWRVCAGALLLGAWAFVTSQFAGPSFDRWVNSATINYSGLMLIQLAVFTRQIAMFADARRRTAQDVA